MRNTTCMADFSEVAHGYDYLFNVFTKSPRGKEFIDALDTCVPGPAHQALTTFDQHWPDIRLNTFISSVSEHKPSEDDCGRLSMWRAFGANPSHVAFIFSLPKYTSAALSLGLLFSPVAYFDETGVSDQLVRVTELIKSNAEFLRTVDPKLLFGFVYQMLTAVVVCLKHKAFDEELEWRIICGPNRIPSELMEVSTEVIAGIPQTVCKILLDASKSPLLAELDMATVFTRLIIGPTQYPAALADAFIRELRELGVQDAGDRVHFSNIPLRT